MAVWTEEAVMAIWIDLSGKHHPAGLSFVARVMDDASNFLLPMSKSAVVAVGAFPALLPHVTHLGLERPLQECLHLHLRLFLPNVNHMRQLMILRGRRSP